MTSISECKTLRRYKVLCECSAFVIIDFQLCRKNAKREGGGMYTGPKDPEAPAGTEPAVEKDTLAASWTASWQLHGSFKDTLAAFYRERFVLYR